MYNYGSSRISSNLSSLNYIDIGSTRNTTLPTLLLDKRRYSLVSYQDMVMSKIAISTEIEAIYNEEWKNRGILPYNKDLLHNRILRLEFPLLEQLKFTYFKISDIPEFVYNRILRDLEAGCCSATISKEKDGDWINIYETERPEDALLLMGVVSILLKNYVTRRLNVPKRLTRIHQLKDYHYEFINHQTRIDSIQQIKLSPEHIDKMTMCKYVDEIFHKSGMLKVLLIHFINLPLINTHHKSYISSPYVPQIGDITTCLYHIFYQQVFDKQFAAKYPKLVFSRWANEIIILNKVNSVNKISNEEIKAFLDSLEHIKGDVTAINCLDEPHPQKLEGCNNPHKDTPLSQKTHISILLDEYGSVNVHKIIET